MGSPSKATFHGYRAGAALARALPERWVPSTEKIAGRFASRIMDDRRAQVERNIRRVYGTELPDTVVDDIVRETFASYVRYWIESFRLPGTPIEQIDAGVSITNFEAITSGLDQGKGLIIALPHLGGWEWAAFWLTLVQGLSVTAVAEAVEPRELADWFMSFRRSLGMELVTLGPGAGAACAKALKENRVLCLVSDRDLAGGGIEVPFLGETTTLPAGPATLAIRSGAPLLTAATYFDGRRHHLVVDDPLDTSRRGRLGDDARRVTMEMAARLESHIRTAPEQWHLLQPNWPSDRLASDS